MPAATRPSAKLYAENSRRVFDEHTSVSFPSTALAASIDLANALSVAQFLVRCNLIGKHTRQLRRNGRGDGWLLVTLRLLMVGTFDNDPELGKMRAVARAIAERDAEALVAVFAPASGTLWGHEITLRGVERLLGIKIRGAAPARAQALREWAARPVVAEAAAA